MKKTKKIIISRSSDYSGGAFGFTLRHFVIYPPSVSVNDILRVKSYSKKKIEFIFVLINKKTIL
jgi:hypothetical protein